MLSHYTVGETELSCLAEIHREQIKSYLTPKMLYFNSFSLPKPMSHVDKSTFSLNALKYE